MEIERYIEEYKTKFLPPKWQWRVGQLETIKGIIECYVNNSNRYVIGECPTGSGKSHIAMCVSYVLNKLGKTGYILTSDISLQNQYEDDLDLCRINWGSVKGIDRYLCTENLEVTSLGVCKLRNCSPKEMPCYATCPYYSNRDKASVSDTSILNYSYWLIQMNECLEKNERVYFPVRDFIICDEAHKITDIVQSHFSPRINSEWIEKIKSLKEFLAERNVNEYNDIIERACKIIQGIIEIDNTTHLYVLMRGFVDIRESLKPCVLFITERANKLYNGRNLPKEWSSAVKNMTFILTLANTMETYLNMVDKTNVDSIIKNRISDTEVVINFLYTNYMVEHFFHKFVKFGVFLSATIGNPQDYCSDMQIMESSFVKMHSTFDFSKSPIHYFNKRKMSYNMMEANTPWLIDKINECIDSHKNQKGIIHSSSYDLTLKIFNGLSEENKDRVLLYNGAEEKEECMKILKESKDKILIGPSLIEGVNLPHEHCRFLIFAKVPYLSLNDNFVKAKLKLDPKWYQMKAIINILQGVGRGVRDDSDWCETYILDANFGDLFTRNRMSFPEEFKNRIILHTE